MNISVDFLLRAVSANVDYIVPLDKSFRIAEHANSLCNGFACLFLVPCYNCKTPHKDCIVCQAYYKVFGRDFLKHRFSTNTHTSTRASEPPPRRTQRYFEQDTGPSYHERAYSAPIPRLKTRLFSTPNIRSSSPKRVS